MMPIHHVFIFPHGVIGFQVEENSNSFAYESFKVDKTISNATMFSKSTLKRAEEFVPHQMVTDVRCQLISAMQW